MKDVFGTRAIGFLYGVVGLSFAGSSLGLSRQLTASVYKVSRVDTVWHKHTNLMLAWNLRVACVGWRSLTCASFTKYFQHL